MKTCPGCLVELDEKDFSSDSSNSDGLRSRCRSCVSVYNRAYYSANRARELHRVKSYNEEHRERRIAYSSAYNAAHPERTDAWAARHPDRARVAAVAYRRSKPEVFRAHANARRARKFANGGSHTLAQWLAKLALFAHLCAYCGEAKPLTRDHKVPLTRGGSDDISNIVPACKSCNSRKKNRTADEFLAIRLVA